MDSFLITEGGQILGYFFRGKKENACATVGAIFSYLVTLVLNF
jgi:hypothetical protein